MEEITFTYGGFNSSSDLNLIVNEIKRGVLGDITEVTQDIPAMDGNVYLGTNYGSKKIDIDCTMKTDTEEERAELIHELGKLFYVSDEDEYDLILSDEPAYAYHAHVSAISTPERIADTSSWSTFTITFTCSKPFAYGEQITVPVNEQTFNINYTGDAITYPVITVIPQTDIKEIAVTNADGDYVYIGEGENTEKNTAEENKEPKILHDECNTLDTWTKLTAENMKFEGENLYISSKADFRSTENAIKIGQKDGKAYFGGTVKGKWHGAGRYQMLPTACKDWRVRVRLFNTEKSYRAKNKIEVYLLATDGTRIGKMMLKDNDNSREVTVGADIGSNTDNRKILYGSTGTVSKVKTTAKSSKTVKVKVGTKTVTKTVNKKKKKVTESVYKTLKLDYDFKQSEYTDFYGWLQIEKIGDKVNFSFMKLKDNGSNAWKNPRKAATYTDKKGYTSKQLGGIAVVSMKYDNKEDFVEGTNDDEQDKIAYTPNDMSLCDVVVWNILDGGNKANNQREIVAYAGEEIKIDSEDSRIYKNGIPFMSSLNIGSTFFKEQGGQEQAYSFYPSPDEAEIFIDYVPTKY